MEPCFSSIIPLLVKDYDNSCYRKMNEEEEEIFTKERFIEFRLREMEEENPSLRYLDGIRDKIGIDYLTNQPIYKKE